MTHIVHSLAQIQDKLCSHLCQQSLCVCPKRSCYLVKGFCGLCLSLVVVAALRLATTPHCVSNSAETSRTCVESVLQMETTTSAFMRRHTPKQTHSHFSTSTRQCIHKCHVCVCRSLCVCVCESEWCKRNANNSEKGNSSYTEPEITNQKKGPVMAAHMRCVWCVSVFAWLFRLVFALCVHAYRYRVVFVHTSTTTKITR